MSLRDNGRVGVQIMPRETLIASGAVYDETQENRQYSASMLRCPRLGFFLKKTSRVFADVPSDQKEKSIVPPSRILSAAEAIKPPRVFKFVDSFEEILEKILDAITQLLNIILYMILSSKPAAALFVLIASILFVSCGKNDSTAAPANGGILTPHTEAESSAKRRTDDFRRL